MSEEKSGWDKIAQQDGQNRKKDETKEKIDTASEVVSSVSWGIYVFVALVVIAVIVGILKLAA